MELESDTEDLRTELISCEETTKRIRRTYKRRTSSCIERLTALEVFACELQSILHVKSNKLLRLEQGITEQERLHLYYERLKDENRKLSELTGLAGEVKELARQQSHEDELKRYYEEKFKLMTLKRHRPDGKQEALKEALKEEEVTAHKLQQNYASLRTALIILTEERDYIDRYVAKLKSNISNSRIITAVTSRLPSRSPTHMGIQGKSKPASCKSSPVLSVHQSVRLSRVSSSKQFVPSHTRKKRIPKLVGRSK